MSKNNGGPAFPTDGRIQHGTEYDGMSLRDYFAGQAFAGMCGGGGVWPRMDDGQEMARRAYAWADAMLEAREK